MEYIPQNPYEISKKPEETGSEKASKKKKRTTKVPLPGYLKTEQEIKKAEQESANDNVLEKLFERTEKKHEDTEEPKEPATEYTDEYDKSELAELSGAEVDETEKPEYAETPEYDTAEEVITNEEDSISQEGEFSDEVPLIISRPEVRSKPEQSASDTEPVTAEAELQNAEFESVFVSPESPEIDEPQNYDEQEIYHQQVRQDQLDFDRYYQSRAAETPKTTEKKITEEELNERVHAATKHGVRRGVISGGLVGWWIGRRGKKEAIKAAKEADEEIEKQDEEIDRLRRNQAMTNERLAAMDQTNEYIKKAIEKQTTPAHESLAVSDSAPERQKPGLEAEKETKKEVLPEDKEVTEEAYLVQKGTKVEQSVWHSIEVDAKTGRKLENPERAYGKEFDNEQRQEKLRSQHSDPGLAFQFGHTVVQSTDSDELSESGKSRNKKSSKRTGKVSKQLIYAKNQIQIQAKNPIIWIAATVIFAMLFVFGILR